MAEHIITARLQYETREAERSLERLTRSSERSERQMKRLTETSKQGSARITADAQSYRRLEEALNKERRAIERLTTTYERFGKTAQKVNMEIHRGSGTRSAMVNHSMVGIQNYLGRYIGPAALAYGGARLIGNAINEEQMRNYLRTVGGTDQLGRQLAQLGGEIGKDRIDLIRGGYQALSSGVQQKNVLGLVKVAARASVAGGPNATVEGAVDILTSMANAYRQPGQQADFSEAQMTKFADMLFKTVELGKIEFNQLQTDLPEILNVGAISGIPMEQLLAGLATASISGVAAPEAATQFKQLMLSVLAPTSESKQRASELGIDLSSKAVKEKGLPRIMKELAEKTKLVPEEMERLFPNIRALQGVLNMFGNNVEKFDEFSQQILTSMGSSGKAFNIMSEGLKDQFTKLKNSTQELVIAFLEDTNLLKIAANSIKLLADAIKNEDFSEIIRQSIEGWGIKLGLVDEEKLINKAAEDYMVFPELGTEHANEYVKKHGVEAAIGAAREEMILAGQAEVDAAQGNFRSLRPEAITRAMGETAYLNKLEETNPDMRQLIEEADRKGLSGQYIKIAQFARANAAITTAQSQRPEYIRLRTMAGEQGYVDPEKSLDIEMNRLRKLVVEEESPLTKFNAFITKAFGPELVDRIQSGFKNIKTLDIQGQQIILSGPISFGNLVGGLFSGGRGTTGDTKSGQSGTVSSAPQAF